MNIPSAPITPPVVDISPLLACRASGHSLSLNEQTTSTCEQLLNAFQQIGFLYISEHGIPIDLQDELEGFAKQFFALPPAEKLKIRMEHAGRAWRGYFPVGAELTTNQPDQKEGLYFGAEHDSNHPLVKAGEPMHGANLWPEGMGTQVPKLITQYMDQMTALGALLMSAIAVGLGLDERYFEQRFREPPTTLFRIFNYPRTDWIEHPHLWSVGEHTDMGLLTILKQDASGGLQVQSRSGQWLDVPYIADTFVINIGDMLELWTWGLLRSTVHRVRNRSQQARLSFPFFFDPSWNCSLERIDRRLLPQVDQQEACQTWGANQRWDQMDLRQLTPNQTYGAFVWQKIRNVFPHLASR